MLIRTGNDEKAVIIDTCGNYAFFIAEGDGCPLMVDLVTMDPWGTDVAESDNLRQFGVTFKYHELRGSNLRIDRLITMLDKMFEMWSIKNNPPICGQCWKIADYTTHDGKNRYNVCERCKHDYRWTDRHVWEEIVPPSHNID